MATVILPMYIQKQIIKIICNDINNKNRLFKSGLTSKETCLMSISLVCHCYFETVSNNITVSNDFQCFSGSINKRNYIRVEMENHFIYKRLMGLIQQQQSKYTLLKYENITEITLNVNEWRVRLEKPSPIIPLINKLVSEKFINLEKLYISSDIRFDFSSDFNFKRLIFKDWHMDFTNELHSNIRDLENLIICLTRLNFSQNQINDIFKHFQSISKLNVPIINETTSTFTYKSIYESFIQQDGSYSENCLTNLEKFRDVDLNIDDMYYVCKLSPNLSNITFGTCIDNLLFQIGIDNEDVSEITPCICSSKQCNQNSKEYWYNVSNYISQSKHLKHFILEHRCTEKLIPEVMDGEDDNEFDYSLMINKYLSNKFMNQVISIISTNNYLNILEFNNEIPHPKQFIDKVKSIKPNLKFTFK